MPRSMPRYPVPKLKSTGPRLWNAKRRIQSSKGLPPQHLQELQEDPYSERWRKVVSQDVVEFIDKYEGRDSTGHPIREMLPEQKLQLLKSPTRYFSRPQNVPLEYRKQVRFPDFTITLLRTPHLGVHFASFEVPLWFGKLDLKSYLQNLYKVDTLHIRSFVVHQKTKRTAPTNKFQNGMLYQPSFKKKMTVQLVKPFKWPAELTKQELNDNSYEANNYWSSTIKYLESSRKEQEQYPKEASRDHRLSIAEQARAILAGNDQWRPTWKQLEPNVKVMEGAPSLLAEPKR